MTSVLSIVEVVMKMYLALVVFVDLPAGQIARTWSGDTHDPPAVQAGAHPRTFTFCFSKQTA